MYFSQAALRPHLAHSNVVQAVRAIEHHTLHSQSLGQVLGGLCLACASRSLRGPIQVEVEGSHQGSITAVSQGGDHQSVRGMHSANFCTWRQNGFSKTML